jgi:cytochrome c oxidase subunit 3
MGIISKMENKGEELRNDIDFRFHPQNVLMILVLAGITALFLAFSAAYIYSRVQNPSPPVQIPILFVFNTILLLGSSFTLHRAKKCYLLDNTEGYQRSLLITIIITVVFLIAQFIAWGQLFSQNIFINSSTSASYLYVISIMHFAHVIAGLPFLVYFLITAYRKMKEPVSVLVYFSDPEKRLKLRLLSLYWHFLDGLWIYLVLFFWFNYLIQ